MNVSACLQNKHCAVQSQDVSLPYSLYSLLCKARYAMDKFKKYINNSQWGLYMVQWRFCHTVPVTGVWSWPPALSVWSLHVLPVTVCLQFPPTSQYKLSLVYVGGIRIEGLMGMVERFICGAKQKKGKVMALPVGAGVGRMCCLHYCCKIGFPLQIIETA